MDFFKTDDGLLHAGRIAGVFYLVGLAFGCDWSSGFLESCSMHLVYTAGWWLAFGSKRVPHHFSDLIEYPLQTAGIMIGVMGILGQFYILQWVAHH